MKLEFQIELRITIKMKTFKNESIPLVKLNPDSNRLEMTNEAVAYLSTLSNPIAITTIAGLYRTGKSFLVNKLLPGSYAYGQQESAFRVGVTTQSMTKGLNILATPITLACPETGKQIDYLLIDSEGIGSCEQSTKYDTDLLILIFLISSTVVYNSMGAIDELSLEQLQVVLQLKACVESTRHECGDSSFRYKAGKVNFVWVLRDFALQLVDKEGNDITADQYLEQCLEESPGTAPETRKKNQIRRAIKEHLGERHCYPLVRPTLKQQDLQNLHNPKSQPQSKLRTEFLGQLENLKESLFSGRESDVKKINGQPITGRLFARILGEFLQVINRNELPKVGDVWASVVKECNQENFWSFMEEMKKEVKGIKLPLPKQELKLKLNEIENRVYKTLEKTICNEQQFKAYHKEFLKTTQRLNKELRERNDELRKNSLLAQLHVFTKQNLVFEALKPAAIWETMKQFIERIKLKISGAEEGYEYLMGVLVDVFFVLQQKSNKIDREFTEVKLLYDGLVMDKKNADLTLMNLKREYHDALKAIAKLQEGQADADKNYSLTKNKIYSYETKIAKLESELKQEKEQYQRSTRQWQQKYKAKIEQLSGQLRKLREENGKLEEELAGVRQKMNQQDLISKKETIFEEKMRESFDRFHEQRMGLKKEIESYKKQVGNVNEKYNQVKNLYEKQCQKQKLLEEAHEKKEKNLIKQFQNLKQTFKQTKASYQKTYQTYQTTEQKMSTLGQPASTSKKQKLQTPGKDPKDLGIKGEENTAESSKMMKKYYETQIEKIQEEHKIERDRLEDRIAGLEKLIERKQTDRQLYFMEAKEYKEKCLKLESDIISANAKFNQFLKEIEEAKQKERMIYEESIVRLLKNIEKRDSENRDCTISSGVDERSSLNLNVHNANRRRERASQNAKESLSFGNVFRTK